MNPKYIDENAAFLDNNLPYFNILIVTATPLEKAELHKCLSPVDSRDGILSIPYKRQSYFLARFGKYNIIHVACGDMGSVGRESSLTTTIDAIEACHPKAVFMIGIAFGVNRKKQKVGDLLVSERVIPYEPQKMGKDHENRGKAGPAGTILINRVRNIHDWLYEIKGRQAELIIGDILTGEKLVDDEDFRKSLTDTYPLAKGGEMEGAGIYAACDARVSEWIMIKGICDYADGTKKINKKANQLTAVGSALSFCERLFNKEFIFTDLGVETAANQGKKSKVIQAVNRLGQVDVKDYLDKQVRRQLKKQINSGKYLRDTFIETGDHKDHLRYFSDPVFYQKKCFEEAQQMDFRMLNRRLKKQNAAEFVFDIIPFYEAFPKKISGVDDMSRKAYQYLVEKKAELEAVKLDSNERYRFGNKLSYRMEDFETLSKRVALITEMAGQGKTNFLCDFAENFLLKANVPAVFLTGSELNAGQIRTSILNKIFPENDQLSFEELMNRMQELSEQSGKYFVIIIDGINENSDTKAFSRQLESFIGEVLEFPYVKIIISCRTEYFQSNFKNIEKSSFKKEILRISSLLRGHRENDIKKKLRDTYFRHFKIKFNRISHKADEQLTANFLLLRIFCEAYEGQTIDFIDNIYKEELFERYYTVKSEEINEKIISNDEFKVTGDFNIRNFLSSLVELMIAKRSYVNIPLDELVDNQNHKQIYIRFLDENILVKRDLEQNAKGLFTSKELVNFTFDEFRDFLISKYLIEKTYRESPEDFSRFLATELTDRSPLEEGCSTFLFFAARRAGDVQLSSVIEAQPWFEDVFSRCVFNLKDDQITYKDKELLIVAIQKGFPVAPRIIFGLLIRHDIAYYPNLNIDLLFAWLRELTAADYERYFTSCWGGKFDHVKIDQQDLIGQCRRILEEAGQEKEFSNHKLFETFIYMFVNASSWEVYELYESYYFKYPDEARVQLQQALNCRNEMLRAEIVLFLEEYEIKL